MFCFTGLFLIEYPSQAFVIHHTFVTMLPKQSKKYPENKKAHPDT